MEKIMLLGFSHKKTPVSIREKIYFSEEEIPELLKKIRRINGIAEAMALSTCNRTEIYIVKNKENDFANKIIEIIRSLKGIEENYLKKYHYFFTGVSAIKHIFKVAAGLDSMVIGENEITSQFKEAFNIALENKSAGRFLFTLFQKTMSAVKKVKSRTDISKGTVSVSYCAVELAARIFKDFSGKSILLIGAGEMAKKAAICFKNKGVKTIDVFNRTFEKAVELSKEYDGIPYGFESLNEAVSSADIILSSANASYPILREQDVMEIMKKRQNKPLFILDIAVPRNIEEKVKHIKNVYLYNIDDLKKIADTNMQLRKNEMIKAVKIVEETAVIFEKEFYIKEISPVIRGIKETIYKIAVEEIEKTARKHNLTQDIKELLKKSVIEVVDSIISRYMEGIRKKIRTVNGDREKFIKIVKEAFKIYG